MKPLNIIFAGTPDFAARHLQALLDSHHNVIGVYTQPDRPAGRGKKLTASPVKELAIANNIPVYQPSSLRKEPAQQQLAELNADIMVVVAYGLILPKVVLDTPRLGCINVHGSILPRWRGAAPIQRAIEAGDAETGVCIMQMDAGLDTGGVISEHRYTLQNHDTAQDVHDALMALGAAAIVADLQQLQQQGYLKAAPQPENGITYAQKLSKEEAKINWNEPAETIARKIRAFNPVPGAWAEWQGKPLKIWRATPTQSNGTASEVLNSDANGITVACGEGALLIQELQPSGSKRMNAAAFLAGRALNKGDRL